jgi:hypothetical protein
VKHDDLGRGLGVPLIEFDEDLVRQLVMDAVQRQRARLERQLRTDL